MMHLKLGEIGILKNMPQEHANLNGEEALVKRLCAAGERFNIAGQRGYATEDGYVVDVRHFGIAWVRNDQLRKPADSAEVDAVTTDLFNRLTKPARVIV